jgi:hypothetical protein
LTGELRTNKEHDWVVGIARMARAARRTNADVDKSANGSNFGALAPMLR